MECGECTLCCTLLPVKVLDKPANTACQHCSAGCSIYEQRPAPCRNYFCEWLKGGFPDWMRPDKSGVVLERLADDMVIVLQRENSKAWLEPDTLAILEGLVATGDTVILRSGNTVQINAPEGVDRLAEYGRMADIAKNMGVG